jgi:hypothetical protein
MKEDVIPIPRYHQFRVADGQLTLWRKGDRAPRVVNLQPYPGHTIVVEKGEIRIHAGGVKVLVGWLAQSSPR